MSVVITGQDVAIRCDPDTTLRIGGKPLRISDTGERNFLSNSLVSDPEQMMGSRSRNHSPNVLLPVSSDCGNTASSRQCSSIPVLNFQKLAVVIHHQLVV